jgi:N6-L-threonylcarbamoyladenine synthase
LTREGCDMSFSGLKTAVLRERDKLIEAQGGITRQNRADLCAGFQSAVSDVLAEKARRALGEYLKLNPSQPTLAVAGGVAANAQIRDALQIAANSANVAFTAPPLSLCTDNAAMIAWAGIELEAINHPGLTPLVARPRWPLDATSPAMLGSGKKGAKA